MIDLPTKALAIRQPWAWAIIDDEAAKDIENRDWKPGNPARRFRGRFLIHASGFERAVYRREAIGYAALRARMETRRRPPLPAFDELKFGGIVGMARVVDIVDRHPSRWFVGPLGLVLADAKPLPFVPCTGALGFFDVPAEVLAALAARMAQQEFDLRTGEAFARLRS